MLCNQAAQQYQHAQHMTDRLVALRGLVHSNAAQTVDCLADFYQHFQQEALVVDSWFAVQASNPKATITDIDALCQHSAFALTNPNRLRSVLAQFANANPVQFHQADGSGYRFVAEKIAELDSKNTDMKRKLDNFKANGKDNWETFKTEFSHDMDELGNAFRDLTVKNTKK